MAVTEAAQMGRSEWGPVEATNSAKWQTWHTTPREGKFTSKEAAELSIFRERLNECSKAAKG
jgi:hypothetical protein